MAILDGGHFDRTLFCLWPGDEAATTAATAANPPLDMSGVQYGAIAGQCCASGGFDAGASCRRVVTEADGSWQCLFEQGSTGFMAGVTYGEVLARCESFGLVLCGQSCKGLGCGHNRHP